MKIVKSRARMTAILAALAMASVTAFAQAPAGGPGAGPPRGPGGGGMGGGFGAAPTDVPGLMQRQGLTDPSLKLTDAQKTNLEKIMTSYLAETKALDEKYPRTQGAAPNADAQAARTKSREDLTVSIGKVLDDSQRKTWEAARAAGRPAGGPGGPGGPGAGGPPPVR